jgi:hypothetical protein
MRVFYASQLREQPTAFRRTFISVHITTQVVWINQSDARRSSGKSPSDAMCSSDAVCYIELSAAQVDAGLYNT